MENIITTVVAISGITGFLALLLSIAIPASCGLAFVAWGLWGALQSLARADYINPLLKVDSKFEAEIKEKFKATTRCIPDAGQFKSIDDFKLKRENTIKVIVARAF